MPKPHACTQGLVTQKTSEKKTTDLCYSHGELASNPSIPSTRKQLSLKYPARVGEKFKSVGGLSSIAKGTHWALDSYYVQVVTDAGPKADSAVRDLGLGLAAVAVGVLPPPVEAVMNLALLATEMGLQSMDDQASSSSSTLVSRVDISGIIQDFSRNVLQTISEEIFVNQLQQLQNMWQFALTYMRRADGFRSTVNTESNKKENLLSYSEHLDTVVKQLDRMYEKINTDNFKEFAYFTMELLAPFVFQHSLSMRLLASSVIPEDLPKQTLRANLMADTASQTQKYINMMYSSACQARNWRLHFISRLTCEQACVCGGSCEHLIYRWFDYFHTGDPQNLVRDDFANSGLVTGWDIIYTYETYLQTMTQLLDDFYFGAADAFYETLARSKEAFNLTHADFSAAREMRPEIPTAWSRTDRCIVAKPSFTEFDPANPPKKSHETTSGTPRANDLHLLRWVGAVSIVWALS